MTRHSIRIAGLLMAAMLGTHDVAGAQAAPAQWITSWYAAPQPGWGKDFLLPMNLPAAIGNQTLRETVRLSAGGKRIRLVLQNRYGRQAVQVGAVRVAPAGEPQLAQGLTFSGQAGVSIAPGASVTSDPIALAAAPLARLEVSSYLPQPTPIASFHWGAQQTIEVDDGDTLDRARAAPARQVEGRLFLSAVLVEAAGPARTVVALGDSITDGNGSTPNLDHRWPDFLARQLTQQRASQGIGVANAGISGARLLSDGMGRNALARFGQDVLDQPGVSDVVILLGINDIGWPGSPFAPAEAPVTLEQLRTAYRQLVAAAHVRGVRVTVGTLPPFEGALEGTPYAGHYSPAKERLRVALNEWIRGAGEFDAVVDFDAVLRDPLHPRRMRAEYDSGDHLHPGDAGYRAMAAAVADLLPTGKALRQMQRSPQS